LSRVMTGAVPRTGSKPCPFIFIAVIYRRP